MTALGSPGGMSFWRKSMEPDRAVDDVTRLSSPVEADLVCDAAPDEMTEPHQGSSARTVPFSTDEDSAGERVSREHERNWRRPLGCQPHLERVAVHPVTPTIGGSNRCLVGT